MRFGGGLILPSTAAETWNPADAGAGLVLTNGNLTASVGSVITRGVRGFNPQTAALKLYYEARKGGAQSFGNTEGVGFALAGASLTAGINQSGLVVGVSDVGNIFNNGAAPFTIAFVNNGDTYCCALDTGNKKAWFRTNGGQWDGNTDDPSTNTGGCDISAWFTGAGTPIYPFCVVADLNQSWTCGFAAASFAFTVPSGFSPWPGS